MIAVAVALVWLLNWAVQRLVLWALALWMLALSGG